VCRASAHQHTSRQKLGLRQDNDLQQDITIRQASPDDAETIQRITDAAYAKYVPLMGRKPQPMTADYQQMLAKHPAWLLLADQQPAGLLVLIHEPDTLLIYSVAIDPAFQGRGLGRRLLAWAEQQAQQAGYSHIRLFTNALMESNIALYGRLGYVETGREPFLGLTTVHMRKRVNDSAADS
jgi:ribosomal protein S18 acetylase RimI-like enzyme